MDKRDFMQIRGMIRAVWKNVIDSEEQADIWYSTFKKYDYQLTKNAVMAYIETSRYEPKPSDILGFIPKGKSNSTFDPAPKFEMVNGKRKRIYICQRCKDSGMITWEDEKQCLYGLPCDCPAGHYYYRWGWLTKELQQAWVNDPKNGYHGEWIGENWYEMQPGRN